MTSTGHMLRCITHCSDRLVSEVFLVKHEDEEVMNHLGYKGGKGWNDVGELNILTHSYVGELKILPVKQMSSLKQTKGRSLRSVRFPSPWSWQTSRLQ